MVVLRETVVTDLLCGLRIERTLKLCIPVQGLTCIGHLIVDVTRMRDSLRDIRCVGSDLRSDDALLYVLEIRKCEVLCRRHIAEEGSAVHRGDRTTDRGRDVIITRCDIRYERSEYIERCPHAEGLLHFHVCRDLVEWHVTRALDHDLNIVRPGTLRELTETYELLDLAYIGRIGETARTAGITERNGDIILLTDIEDLVEVLVERVLLAGHAHPCEHKAAATADDVHLPLMLADLLDGLLGDTTVQSHEVDTVLRMQTDDIEEILRGQGIEVTLVVDDAVVDRHRTDHRRTLLTELLTERLCISMAGKIHDGLCTHTNSTHYLLHLEIIILHVSRHTEVYVDLRPKHRADTLRIQTGMVLVCADRDLTLGHQLTKLLLRHMLLLCDDLHLRCDDTLARRIHLCCIILHIFSFSDSD